VQRGVEQPVGQRPGRAGRARRLERPAHLTLHLGLADDHRLEAGGHAEELARGVAVARRVDDLGQLGGPDPARADSAPSAAVSASTGR
jgi:hypothetical protein